MEFPIGELTGRNFLTIFRLFLIVRLIHYLVIVRRRFPAVVFVIR
jgi:hypothetical protein